MSHQSDLLVLVPVPDDVSDECFAVIGWENVTGIYLYRILESDDAYL